MKILSFGALFGFILSRSGATDYDLITHMFLLRDLHLMGVIGVGVVIGAAGFAYLQATHKAPTCLKQKPTRAGNLWGGMLFGVGWALTGTCPGTVLAQVGEGKMLAFATLAGMLIGTWLYRKVGLAVEERLPNIWAMFTASQATNP